MNEQRPAPRFGIPKRDLFKAFVCDDLSMDLVGATCATLGWSGECIFKGGIKNAIQSLSISSSPSILFIDLSDSTVPLRDVNALAEVCEPGTIVIVGGHMNDVRLYRDLLASGIQDYLLKPFHPDQLRDSFVHAQTILTSPRPSDTPEIPHFQVSVMGARGGVGASMIASALAWSMALHQRRTTTLLDLDVHFGTSALGFDLSPGKGLAEAIDNPSRIDGLFLERALVHASEKLSVLAAEASIMQPLLSDGTAFRLLQEELKTGFECTIADLPRDLAVMCPHLLGDIHTLLLVAEPSLACARDIFRLLNWLKTAAPLVRPQVILNKMAANGIIEISLGDFEKAIEQAVDVILPDDPKIVRECARLGKAVTDAGRSSKLGQALQAYAANLIEQVGAPSAPTSHAEAKPPALASVLQKMSFWGTKKDAPSQNRYAVR